MGMHALFQVQHEPISSIFSPLFDQTIPCNFLACSSRCILRWLFFVWLDRDIESCTCLLTFIQPGILVRWRGSIQVSNPETIPRHGWLSDVQLLKVYLVRENRGGIELRFRPLFGGVFRRPNRFLLKTESIPLTKGIAIPHFAFSNKESRLHIYFII